MGPLSCFTSCRILLLSFLLILLLLLSNAFGRTLVNNFDHNNEHAIATALDQQRKSREMYELDYADAGPNINGRSGYLIPDPSPPPPPPPPRPSPPPPPIEFGF